MRIFGGIDPATGRQLILTGSAATEDDAVTMRDGFRREIAEHTAVRTNVALRMLLAEWLAGHQVEPSTRESYQLLIDKFILPTLGDQTLPALAKLGPRPYERLYAELRTCRRRCTGKPFIEHRTPRPHACDDRCRPHACRPPASSSIRQCHAVLSSTFAAAVRWGWIAVNPMASAQKPRPAAPDPDPPTSDEAARIVAAARADDPEWGEQPSDDADQAPDCATPKDDWNSNATHHTSISNQFERDATSMRHPGCAVQSSSSGAHHLPGRRIAGTSQG